MDEITAARHKQIYNQLLDELDIEIVKEIFEHPEGEEAMLLNEKVAKKMEELNS